LRRLSEGRDHRWAQPRLSDYVEAGLSRRAARRLARHEELCANCRRLVRTLHALLALLGELRYADSAETSIADTMARRIGARIGARR
jgi:hypothetical protein